MTDAANYLKDSLVLWMTDGQSFDAPPSNLYVALHTGDPGEDGSQNEVSAASYQRYESAIPGGWIQPSTGDFENDNDFVFPEAEEDWGDISYMTLWDGSASTDNCLARSVLVNTTTVNTGDTPIFRAGSLTGSFE